MAHICNPRYYGAGGQENKRDQEDHFLPEQTINKTLPQTRSQEHGTVSATQEAEVERSQFEANPDEICARSYLENQRKAKGLGAWHKW
jgi:hypothetical protein